MREGMKNVFILQCRQLLELYIVHGSYMKYKYGLFAEFYWRGKTEGTVRRKCLSMNFFATSTTWKGVWLNPVLRGEKWMGHWDMIRPKPSFLAFLGKAAFVFNCLLDDFLLQSRFKTKCIVPESSVEKANSSVIIVSPAMCNKASFS